MGTRTLRSLLFVLLACPLACTQPGSHSLQQQLVNAAVRKHDMLHDLYSDGYFPLRLVDECKAVLVDLCLEIETQHPRDLPAFYTLTHRATERLNGLQAAFEASDSEIETVAREAFGAEFEFIAKAYGFTDADVEEMIAPREW